MYEKRVQDETKRQTNSLEILPKQNETKARSRSHRARVSATSKCRLNKRNYIVRVTNTRAIRDAISICCTATHSNEFAKCSFLSAAGRLPHPKSRKSLVVQFAATVHRGDKKKLNLAQHTDSPTRWHWYPTINCFRYFFALNLFFSL